ncbi:MAG: PilZ domain-containing protein [Hyphomicrobiaceae bacterium]
MLESLHLPADDIDTITIEPTITNAAADVTRLRLVHEELVESAMLTCVTANLFANVTEATQRECLHDLRSYLPPEPTAFSSCLTEEITGDHSGTIMQNLLGYYEAVAVLRSLTVWYCKALQHGAPERPTSLASLASGWRSAAADALATLRSLADLRRYPVSSSTAARAADVVRLLEMTRNGLTPCLGPHGTVVVSVAPEKRDASRAQATRQVYVELGSGIQRALVLDVSRHGVGLWGLTDTKLDDAVRIICRPGVAIDGRVVWTEHRRCGIRLDTPLPTETSVIRHLTTAQVA